MSSYKPAAPFATEMFLFNPTIEDTDGIRTKKLPTNGELFNGSFKTFGGTEKTVDGVLAVEDTATIETWYRPDIQAKSIIKVAGTHYEVLGTPEDILMRHQYMKFKVRAVKGGA